MLIAFKFKVIKLKVRLRYYRRLAIIHLNMRQKLIRLNISCWFVRLAFKISRDAEKAVRDYFIESVYLDEIY